jgi:hypothetical protein
MPQKVTPQNGLLAFLRLIELLVFSSETFDPTGRIHELLLTRKERMALGADFNGDIRFGRSHVHDVSTGTLDFRLSIFGM